MAARRVDMTLDWEKLSREDLVKEYLETRLASLVNHIGVDWCWMPSDVSQDPIYWKMKDENLHDMHYEIARRYNIARDDCLWLENIVDSINLYLTDRKLKPLIEDAIKRLEKLEEIANTTPGVEKSFAIQAGREIRIIAKPEDVNDEEIVFLAREISKKIESELEYPGQIKVNVVRETRAIDYAK